MPISKATRSRPFAAALAPLACALSALIGCGAGDPDAVAAGHPNPSAESDLAELDQSLVSCNNVDGTNAVMAALAVSAAQELKRWQPSRDFVVFTTSGQSEASPGRQQAIKLTSTGKAQCSDGRCWNTQALLDLQYDQANGKIKFPGNVTLSPAALRSRLVAKLREQQACESRPANGGNNCPVEEHTLTFQRAEKGGCDTNFFFKATQPNGRALKFPAQLENKLQWADVQNPYIAFQSSGEVVSIDPTYGLNQANSTTSGNCYAACARMSSTNVAGSCCSCNGSNKKFVKSAWSTTTFICQ